MSCPPFLPVRWFIGPPDVMGAPNVFPFLVGQKFLVQKSPIRKTQVATSASGRERRASYWTAPRWLFKTRYELLRTYTAPNELATLIAFYQQQSGELSDWCYFDHTDNQAVNQAIGIGDGNTTTFQLLRYINGNPSAADPIYAVSGRPTVYVGGSAVSFTLGNYGAVTLAAPPALGALVSWSGYFVFLCRFETDQIDPAQDFSGIWSLNEIAWRSVKPNRT